MILTNKSGLPDILLKAVKNDSYNAGASDYSATSLLKPPRILALTKKHFNELEEDAEDRLWSLYGQIAHLIIERSQTKNDLTEERYFTTVNNKIISAQVDHLCLQGGILTDWKFTTAWKFKLNALVDKDWEAQLNIQNFVLYQNGIRATSLQIIGLIRDFSKLEALRNETYPKHSVQVRNISMWPLDKTERFIKERISLHEAAKTNPPLCSPEETWKSEDVWAHMKKGNKRAIKLYYSEKTLPKLGPGEYIEFRHGEHKRCENYCAVNKFCDQFKTYKQLKNEGEINVTAN